MQNNIQFQRKRKALLVLPFIIVALSALCFYALGGGKESKPVTAATNQGLNTTLPSAQFDKHEKAKDKMSFYTQATLDSAKQQSNNNSPFLKQLGFKSKENTEQVTSNSALTSAYADPNVVKINQKLADINRQISQPQTPPVLPVSVTNKPVADKTLTDQVTKLETLMKSMNNSQGSDPQMQQLSKMLEQIQQIQHPELVKADTKTAAPTDNPFKAVSATIDGKQKVRQAGAVKLRLNDSLIVKGQIIPKSSPVYGTANITNQRLLISIKNIRLGQSIIPVDLAVYYTDGMPGIPAPEAEFGEAAAGGADNAMQSMEFLSMDQSLATQAAAGGISAAKTLFSKKVKRIVVHLKNGDAVLLRNNQIH
ncbi:MAG: conjugative transposon protein TraM [Mucilaginibacter sp.]|uniref:conjugative transposon protein TraM n=1 Tax=Mucilaginibacter sp. TaxID=1882438 RepID=UPI0032650435